MLLLVALSVISYSDACTSKMYAAYLAILLLVQDRHRPILVLFGHEEVQKVRRLGFRVSIKSTDTPQTGRRKRPAHPASYVYRCRVILAAAVEAFIVFFMVILPIKPYAVRDSLQCQRTYRGGVPRLRTVTRDETVPKNGKLFLC